MEQGERGTGGPVNATTKVLRVLDALPDHPGLGDLARAAGLPKSTVHRILQTMVADGFAVVDEAGGYRPGPRALGLVGRVLGGAADLPGAEPALRRLQERTGATVHLAVLSGDEAVYVRKIEGRKPYRMASRVGMAIPLHCTAIGKALLAGMPERTVREVVDRTGLVRRTTHTLGGVEDLLADLARVRDRGWAADREENEVGIVCVGAQVRDPSGSTGAALSVSQLLGDAERLPEDELGPLVAGAAAEVSSALGGR